MTLKKTPQTIMMIMIMNKFQPALSQAGLLLTLIPVSYNLNQHLEHVCCKKQQKKSSWPIRGHSITTWTRWGGGVKKSVFVQAQGIKTVHAGGGGVKKWQNYVHVVVEWLLTGLWNRGHLKILNSIKFILDDQGNHLDSFKISLESFRFFKSPLFLNPVLN